ncbi:MAG: Veg family protein [Christensenellaceae bacterium]|jgi:uncharacterized protein Veg|nr:Veg family protein [Christensenellaceae bacterium]
MKKVALSIDSVRSKVKELIGKNINMQVCRGRKQVKRYKGVVERTFPSVFVVRLTEGDTPVLSLSYSYNDIVCGEVIINEA